MYHSILVPVDGTPFGEHAIPQAAAIARRSGAILHLAHVHEPLMVPAFEAATAVRGAGNEVVRAQERAYLDALVERVAGAHEVQVEGFLVEGPVAEALESHAVNSGASLVVMSTHAHAGLARFWHPGVADSLNRHLALPLLLVHPRGEAEEPPLESVPVLRHILVPLDRAPEAAEIVHHAVALGRVFGAHYTLLQVVKPVIEIGYTLLGQDGHINQHRQGQDEAAARRQLGALAERLRGLGLEVRVAVVTSDDPAGAILEQVRATAADPAGPVDLIAMECHPHGAVSRYVGSHTVDAVLRDSPVAVLLFHPTPVPEGSRETAAGVW